MPQLEILGIEGHPYKGALQAHTRVSSGFLFETTARATVPGAEPPDGDEKTPPKPQKSSAQPAGGRPCVICGCRGCGDGFSLTACDTMFAIDQTRTDQRPKNLDGGFFLLVVPGLRSYSPRLGRWVSRDPIEEKGGSNLFCFLLDEPISQLDALGFWGTSVHKVWTTRWARQVGIQQDTAERIGAADDAVDTRFNPAAINDDNWSWHFNRSMSGDSRFDHRDHMLEVAKARCQDGIDEPKEAAKALGFALHPDQDWVAHGDYNRKQEAPNASWSNQVAYYNHNFGGIGPHSTTLPDDEGLDANGSTAGGRATIDVLKEEGWHRVLDNKDVVYWVSYHAGTQRLVLTKDRTKMWLSQFQDYVKSQRSACKCQACFLGR